MSGIGQPLEQDVTRLNAGFKITLVLAALMWAPLLLSLDTLTSSHLAAVAQTSASRTPADGGSVITLGRRTWRLRINPRLLIFAVLFTVAILLAGAVRIIVIAIRRRSVHHENLRILEELDAKKVETLRAHADRDAAEARAAMADQLAHANQELEASNRKLKETQAQLIQTEKMASLGQLVAGIAHEINNPLAFVVNHLYTVESALDRIAPEAEPHLSETSLGKLRKVRARLLEMGEGLDRMKGLVLHLRTFSRLDEGEFKTIDVGDSIDSVLVLLQHRMNGRIQVERRYGPHRRLFCYAGRLNQVFMNLISNAADAIEGKGKIVISTSQTDDAFLISVRDSGKGIPEAIRSRIFDPFFTTKPVGHGTGLGLAISYGIIQDHHGSIAVQSQEGAGSEFDIRIPRDLESRRRE